MGPWVFFWFFAGLGLLVAGAELLVRGAARLAITLGISPLVVGLTVVAYGTSAPELAVSVQSSLSGQPHLLLGNVVGSNICNVLLVLGISAMVTPLTVHKRLVRLEVPLMIGVSVLVFGMAWNGRIITQTESLVLLALAVVYTAFTVILGRKERLEPDSELEALARTHRRHPALDAAWQLGLVAAGLGCLVIGSDWLVDSAVSTARTLGISELVIGLTVVAIGTSLPEVATAVVAVRKGERDLAVGNVVGSNLLNLLAVLGMAGAVSSRGIPVPEAAISFGMPVMVAAAVACLPIFFTGERISRREGALFFGYYVAYTVYLVLQATRDPLLQEYKLFMVVFVIPITVVTLVILFLRAIPVRR